MTGTARRDRKQAVIAYDSRVWPGKLLWLENRPPVNKKRVR